MPFEKGTSGNPTGRPRGTPDRRRLVRDLLMPDAPNLVSKAVQLALAGDTVMLKACLDKLIPNARPSTEVQFMGGEGVGALGRNIVGHVGDGKLSLEDGKLAMEMLAIQAKLEEQDSLVERLDALETQYAVD